MLTSPRHPDSSTATTTFALLCISSAHGPGFVHSRRPLTGAWFSPHYPGVPAMVEVQAEALNMEHFSAEKNALALRLQHGDIELVNNFVLFHARREFGDDTSAPRHLVRLWLRSRVRTWQSPDVVTNSSREIYDGQGEFRSKPARLGYILVASAEQRRAQEDGLQLINALPHRFPILLRPFVQDLLRDWQHGVLCQANSLFEPSCIYQVQLHLGTSHDSVIFSYFLRSSLTIVAAVARINISSITCAQSIVSRQRQTACEINTT